MAAVSPTTANETTSRTHHRSPSLRRAMLGTLTVVLLLVGGASVAGASAAVDQTPAGVAQSSVTTSTLPVDNRVLGNSLTRPNQGAQPLDAGEPGGWLQVSLFFLVTAGVVLMAAAVWWTSRRARLARTAAGLDPIQVATASGTGVRSARMPVPEDVDQTT